MLYTRVRNGILFIVLEGNVDEGIINTFSDEIDYMLYKQGINYFAFNFNNVLDFNNKFVEMFQNKLVEIFLRCGKVALYGINRKLIGNRKDSLFYVDNQKEIDRLLSL